MLVLSYGYSLVMLFKLSYVIDWIGVYVRYILEVLFYIYCVSNYLFATKKDHLYVANELCWICSYVPDIFGWLICRIKLFWDR